MKRLFAVMLVCLLCLSTAYAAEWGEGLGPQQPYPGLPEVQLDEQMGYSFFFPSHKLAANYFCDVLEIYLPREDVALGEGHAHLYDSQGEVADIDFADPDQVELRPLEESELTAMQFGGGTCIEIHLPVSLKFDESYYVLMDLYCYSAMDGKIPNYDLLDVEPKQWDPQLNGDFGISGLYYAAAPEPSEEEAEEDGEEASEEAAEPTEAPEEEGPVEPKLKPEVGDIIHFDLVLGGDAKTAVVFSENDSAYFETLEFTESTTVTGTVTKSDLDWGVVFLDENNETVMDGDRAMVIKPAWAGQEDGGAEEASDAGEIEEIEEIGG